MSDVGFRAGNLVGWVGLAGPKSGRAKILAAQSVLKIELVRPNSLLKTKKIWTDRAGPGHTGPSHIGPGQSILGRAKFDPIFFELII